MTRLWWALRTLVTAAVLGACLCGCGVPHDDRTTVIPPSDLPGELTVPNASPRVASTSSAPTSPAAQVVWVHEGELVTTGLGGPAGGGTDRLDASLAALLAGPTADDRARGYGTALAPDARVYLRGLSDGIAIVDLDLGKAAPSADQLPIAIGQVVLTVTSVPGVRAVRFQQGGEPLSAPLPDGALKPGPVARSDYVALLE